MALPRYLYSVTNSMQTPLLSVSPSEQERELEGDVTAEASGSRSESQTLTVVAEDNAEGRFSNVVELTSPEQQRTDIYTSSRLTAAGIPSLSQEEQREENKLLGVHNLSGYANDPVDDDNVSGYGSNDLRIRRASPTINGRPLSGETSDIVFYKNDRGRTKHEDAALYVREGEDNAKFYHHPKGKWSKKAYKVLHNSSYYIANFIVCLLLMLLALVETPNIGDDANLSKGAERAIVVVHAILEICFLFVLWIDIFLRLLWFRPKHFFRHRRTMIILVVLVVMSVEAITVLVRQENHFRITRALRPIFFLDTYLMVGVRRVLRQIFLCIKPIVDVLILLLFTLVFFSLLGYYIFAEIDSTFFDSFSKTIVSFFITLTTANHPDVLMEAYDQQPASPIFFIIYIIVMVYFISNVLLAVVYSSFSDADKNKFKKLFLHKRDALRHAYNVLATSQQGIIFHDFLIFMQYYRPRIPEWQVMCIFKALHEDPRQQHQDLSLEEFYGFYEVRDFKWKRVTADGLEVPWFEHFVPVFKTPVKSVYTLVKTRWFNLIINLVVLVNLLFLVIYTLTIPIEDVKERFDKLQVVLPVSFIFVSIYSIEICLRIFGLGPFNYFRKLRNIIDSAIILVSLVLLIVEAVNPVYACLAVFRPVKLLRLLRLKRRYRDIMNTIIVLSRRLISVGILLLIIYYVFAIIGLEFFNGAVSKGCCNNSWYGVGQYYSGNDLMPNITDMSITPNVYYLNNFDNILRSYVTLFILMVVNNWYIIMEGFASTSPNDWLVRIYFMSFYIITLVVLQVIISFIVEAFVFKIQAVERKRTCRAHPNRRCDCYKALERKKTVTILLVSQDIIKLKYEIAYNDEKGPTKSFSQFIRHRRRVDLENLPPTHTLTYSGRRLRTKDDIYLLMYRSELSHWIQERDRELEGFEEINPKKPVLRIVWSYFLGFIEYIIE